MGSIYGAYLGTAMQPGLGDGTDGRFDNRANFGDLSKNVSVLGGAMRDWGNANKHITGSSPTVAITAPTKDTVFTYPHNTVTLSVSASETHGEISHVQFYLNGAPIGAPIHQAPFTASVTLTTLGNSTLTAEVFDTNGVVVTSAPVHITLAAPNTPQKLVIPALAYAWDAQQNGSWSYYGWTGNKLAMMPVTSQPGNLSSSECVTNCFTGAGFTAGNSYTDGAVKPTTWAAYDTDIAHSDVFGAANGAQDIANARLTFAFNGMKIIGGFHLWNLNASWLKQLSTAEGINNIQKVEYSIDGGLNWSTVALAAGVTAFTRAAGAATYTGADNQLSTPVLCDHLRFVLGASSPTFQPDGKALAFGLSQIVFYTPAPPARAADQHHQPAGIKHLAD